MCATQSASAGAPEVERAALGARLKVVDGHRLAHSPGNPGRKPRATRQRARRWAGRGRAANRKLHGARVQRRHGKARAQLPYRHHRALHVGRLQRLLGTMPRWGVL